MAVCWEPVCIIDIIWIDCNLHFRCLPSFECPKICTSKCPLSIAKVFSSFISMCFLPSVNTKTKQKQTTPFRVCHPSPIPGPFSSFSTVYTSRAHGNLFSMLFGPFRCTHTHTHARQSTIIYMSEIRSLLLLHTCVCARISLNYRLNQKKTCCDLKKQNRQTRINAYKQTKNNQQQKNQQKTPKQIY